MKKTISVLLVVLLTGVLGLTAFAATPRLDNAVAALTQRQEKIDQKKAEIEAKLQQFKTKQEEWGAFKKALSDKRVAMMTNEKQNHELESQNNQLRLQLTQALKTKKDSEEVLSQETRTALKQNQEAIKVIITELKAGNGQIKDLMLQNKELIKAKDYVKMDLVFDQIANIQLTRSEQLKEINSILVKMLGLL